MKLRWFWVLACMGLVLAGCNKKHSDVTAKAGEKVESGATGQKSVEIPKSLQNDAYRYLGLDKDHELQYTFSGYVGAPAGPGSEKTTFKSVDKDVAHYKTETTGALKIGGDEDYELRADGVYVTGISVGKLNAPSLLLPAKLEPGSKWDSTLDIDFPQGHQVLKLKNTVVRVEKLTTPGGTFDALLVMTKGSGGTFKDMETKMWLVEGKGIVKKVEYAEGNGKTIRVTTELAAEAKKQ